ncbi:MAG TPA: serine hydrolase domain-containing protein [Elusimicrobiota bacterium]|nr:serine hydrolase domain-containing protein [Elusimicrobiota bacterium]
MEVISVAVRALVLVVGFAVPRAAAAESLSRSSAAVERPDFFETNMSSAGFFPQASPESLGVDRAVLGELLEQPAAQHSDALIILKNGRVLAERYFASRPRPLPLASVTKVITSLAIMALLADGRISSIDAPMSTWFPDWKRGPKHGITLRHVLTHRSGLNCERGIAEGDGKLIYQYDTVAFSAAQPVKDEPGKRYCYNNAAIQLLAQVIRSASGESADDYLDHRIFGPMGVTHLRWALDGSGTPLLYGGLSIDARDLAKVGQLMLQEGRWEGRQLLPPEIIRSFTTASEYPSLGLIWDLISGPDGAPLGYYHDGSGGQYLVIYPRLGLVAVRLHEMGRGDGEHDGFGRLYALLRKLGQNAGSGVVDKKRFPH